MRLTIFEYLKSLLYFLLAPKHVSLFTITLTKHFFVCQNLVAPKIIHFYELLNCLFHFSYCLQIFFIYLLHFQKKHFLNHLVHLIILYCYLCSINIDINSLKSMIFQETYFMQFKIYCEIFFTIVQPYFL